MHVVGFMLTKDRGLKLYRPLLTQRGLGVNRAGSIQRNATSFSPFYLSSFESFLSPMADQQRSTVIEENPIDEGLDVFRASFSSICENKSILCSPDAVGQLDQEGIVNQLCRNMPF